MNIVCPFCNASHRIRDARIPDDRRLHARCKRCGGSIVIDPSRQSRPAAAGAFRPPEPKPDTGTGFSLADLQDLPASSEQRNVSNLDCIRFGWQAVKGDPVLTVVGMIIVPFAIQSAAEVIRSVLPPAAETAAALLALTAVFLEMVVTLGIAAISLKLVDGETADLRDLHAYFRRVPAYIGASLLIGILCLVGFALFVVPGVLFSVWFSFYALVIVDTHAGPLRALKQSYTLARGNFWRIAGFWGWVFLLNLLGLIPCGMGLLLTLPITFVAWARLYRALQA